jgi:hypothetical protein
MQILQAKKSLVPYLCQLPWFLVKRMSDLPISTLPVLKKCHGRNNKVYLLQLRRTLYMCKVPTGAIKLATLV